MDATVRAVLDHLARYRLSVLPAMARLRELSHAGSTALGEALERARRAPWIAAAPLHAETCYWHLTEAGAALVGLPPRRSGPLSPWARLRAFAALSFCCLAEHPRLLLSRDELARVCPPLARPGLPTGYYYDPASSGRLGLLRIDVARRGRWDRVVEAVRQDITRHCRDGGLRALVAGGQLEITIITLFRQKAERLAAELARHPDAQRLPVRVVALPALLPLVTSCR